MDGKDFFSGFRKGQVGIVKLASVQFLIVGAVQRVIIAGFRCLDIQVIAALDVYKRQVHDNPLFCFWEDARLRPLFFCTGFRKNRDFAGISLGSERFLREEEQRQQA